LENFWAEIQQRKAKEINLYNHTGATLIAIDQADKQESTNLERNRWLPFDLGEKEKGLSISPDLAEFLVKLRDRDELPPMMLKDLYTHKLIKPG
jgi:hypothetical protein